MLALTGQPFWQEESYDHVTRDEREFEKIRSYIEENPVGAGLVRNAGDYRWSSAGGPPGGSALLACRVCARLEVMRVRLSVFVPLLALPIAASVYLGDFRLLPILAGLLLWTGIEYLMHRFAFHGFAPHWQHHEQPKERKYIVAPLMLSLPVAAGMGLVLWLTGRSELVVSGVIAGYLAYELVHLRIHSAAAGGRVLRALRRYHYYHHFADDHVCYGVTTPLWDAVFASLPPRTRRVNAAR